MAVRFKSGFSTTIFGALAVIALSGTASAGPVGVAKPEISVGAVSPICAHYWRYRHYHHRYHHHHWR